MMAKGIVPRAAKQNMRGPGAARLAHVRVITTTTKTPQVLICANAIDREFVSFPPDVLQTQVAYLAAGIRCGW